MLPDEDEGGLATPFWKTKPRPVDTPTGVGVAVVDAALGVRDEFLLIIEDGVCFKKEPRVLLVPAPENLDPTWHSGCLSLTEGAVHT